jgi:hypothetical protein
MADEILTERRDRILVITLNRPEAKNAVNGPLADALNTAIEELDEDAGLTAGVITGAGGGFSSGMDLKWFATKGPPAGLGKFLRTGAKKPLIAAIEGFALAGGLEMALGNAACFSYSQDFSLASTSIRRHPIGICVKNLSPADNPPARAGDETWGRTTLVRIPSVAHSQAAACVSERIASLTSA